MTATTTTVGLIAPRKKRIPMRILVPSIILALITIIGVIGPLLSGYEPIAASTTDRLKAPGTTLSDGSVALLGTDQVGQDLLGQMMMGARVSLAVGISTLVLAGLMGVLLGLLAGYFGGILDSIIMRLADIQLAFPSILFAILIAAVLGPGVVNVVLVLAICNWVTFARVTRSQVLTLKNREYVEAARTLGAGHAHLIFRTLLPGCVAPAIVVATVELGHVILAEAALSFLGLGVPMSVPSWGSTIANGRDYLTDAWWISTFPGIALATLVLCFGILGDALRDRFDPRLKGATR